MHPNPRRVIPVILLVAAAGFAYWYFYARAAADTGALTASGTIEAVQVVVSPELGGRVTAVHVEEGAAVRAGEVLVQFDTALLEAQREQAAAALAGAQAGNAAARAALDAALASYKLLRAGPSAEQLAVAQTVVDRAALTADAAQQAYEALPEAARETSQGRSLKQQWDQALAALANAQAQYDLAAAGARPEQLAAAQAQVEAAQAQVDAAQAQVEAARAALGVLDVQISKLTLTAPMDGVVLSRAVQPGEVASPGAALLVLGQVDDLTITVYAPTDRYGNIRLGQAARVSVDSFPGEAFAATVVRIADQFEFTPRNVQTAEGRRSTVFAIRLSIDNRDGNLKPGMPADVVFSDQ